MNYPSIRIEGSILSPDILEKLDDANGQRPVDFGLEATSKVKDEIARAWADAQDYWRIYNRKLETLKEDSPATTETRNLWVVPLLGLLGYQLEYEAKSIELNNKLYPISHRVTNRGNAAIHIIGCNEPAGLDRKPGTALNSSFNRHPSSLSSKMSAHAMMQEYLNLTEQLYGIVTNGKLLRLLQDSSRLVKLTYLEFDLDRIFTDGLFADFAILYRLLHVTRLPAQLENSADSIIERGQWKISCFLDNKEVPVINAYFEDSEDVGDGIELIENAESMYVGSVFLGDGFLLSHEDADKMKKFDSCNAEVIMRLINGQELNNRPDRSHGRSIINFYDWTIEKAQQYRIPYEQLLKLVKPVREENNRAVRRERWWQYAEKASGLYKRIKDKNHCFAVARTTKHLSFSSIPTDIVVSDSIYVFTTDRWDLYSVIQSTIHEVWARKYSGALKQDLRYSPSKCFVTFPFPEGLWISVNSNLTIFGEHYHEHRRALMLRLWLGLTDIYNLFHSKEVSGEQRAASCESLSPLADNRSPLALNHDFHEVETLPENDRVRYTISPDARKELLKRLLALNHQRAEEEASKKPVKAVKAGKTKGKKSATDEPGLF